MTAQNKKNLFILSVFVIFILFSFTGLLNPIFNLLSPWTNQIQSYVVKTATDANDYGGLLSFSKAKLIEEINRLQAENNNLTAKLLELKTMERQNKDLTEMLAFSKESRATLVVADVIQKNNFDQNRSIVINKGASQNIQPGYAVIYGEGTLIGKVISVSTATALVRLTIDRRSSVLATLVDNNNIITGALQGVQGTSLSLNFIPKTISLRPHQKVMTNGLEKFVPPSLYLGKIVTLIESENEIFNAALVEPPYVMENLFTVAVLIPQITHTEF